MADNISLAILSETQPRLVNFAFFLCGALLMLSFAPFGWYVLAPLLLVPFLYSTLHSSPKQAAWHGFWLGAGLFLAGTYWLYISIHVFGQAPLIIAIVIMLGLVFIMGCYYAVSGWLICRLCEGNVGRFLLLAPAVWVFVEWLRGWFLSGFPWMSMGYGQIDSTLSAFAPRNRESCGFFSVWGCFRVVIPISDTAEIRKDRALIANAPITPMAA